MRNNNNMGDNKGNALTVTENTRTSRDCRGCSELEKVETPTSLDRPLRFVKIPHTSASEEEASKLREVNPAA